MTSVWILTSEVTAYDQHGEYFEAVFSRIPTIEELRMYTNCDEDEYNHIINVGGPLDKDIWYNLKKVDFADCHTNVEGATDKV